MTSKFAERLKELRLKHGLTQEKLATKTHLSQTAISAYEMRRNRPSDDVIIILCEFFKVSADYLIGISDK